MTVTTVFFDAGETLLHAHPTFPDLFAETVTREGHAIDPVLVHDRFHIVVDRFSAAAADGNLWTTSAAASRAFWHDAYNAFLEDLGVIHDGTLVERVYAAFTDIANYRVFDDVIPVLDHLRDSGIRMGLISNFEDWLSGLLESLGLTAYFEVQVISGLVGLEKPDPAIFRLALDQVGVGPEVSAYVGDSPEFDMVPATGLGMLPVLIDRRDRHPSSTALRIRTMAELPALLKADG